MRSGVRVPPRPQRPYIRAETLRTPLYHQDMAVSCVYHNPNQARMASCVGRSDRCIHGLHAQSAGHAMQPGDAAVLSFTRARSLHGWNGRASLLARCHFPARSARSRRIGQQEESRVEGSGPRARRKVAGNSPEGKGLLGRARQVCHTKGGKEDVAGAHRGRGKDGHSTLHKRTR